MDLNYPVNLQPLFNETINGQINHIVQLAQKVFDVPIAFVRLKDSNRQWSAANSVENATTVINKITQNIEQASQLSDPFDEFSIMEINDVAQDLVLHDNSIVEYKSCTPLYDMAFKLQFKKKTNDGIFCLIDTNRHELDERDREIIKKLGNLIQDNLDHVYTEENKTDTNTDQQVIVKDLEEMLSYFDHCHNLTKLIDKELKKFGVHFKEWRVLDHIHKATTISPAKICNLLHWSNPLLSTYLDKLEDKDLIYRKHMQKRDKRIVNLSCTDKGIEIWRVGWKLSNDIAKCRLSDNSV